MSDTPNSDTPNKDHANLPLVVFSALLQTGAGIALASSGAIAANNPAQNPTQSTPPSAAPQLILQPDGSVTPIDSANNQSNQGIAQIPSHQVTPHQMIPQMTSLSAQPKPATPTAKQIDEPAESMRQLIISEDGSICLSETAVEVSEEATAVPVTDERAAVLEGAVDVCVADIEEPLETDTVDIETVEVEEAEEDSMMS